MKRIFMKRILIILLPLLSLTLLTTGCSARTHILKEQGKAECYLDQEDAAKFIYKEQSYTILNDTVDKNNSGDWIGFISKYAAVTEDYRITKMKDMDLNIVGSLKSLADESNHAAYYVPYLNVYKYKDREDSTCLIVDADHALHRAVLSDYVKDGDVKIVFTKQTGSDISESDLPEINKNDVRQLVWNRKLYQITDQKVPDEKLGDYLCTLTGNITFNAENGRELTLDELTHIEMAPGYFSQQTRKNWIFGSVNKLSEDAGDRLAVEINYNYVYAVLLK